MTARERVFLILAIVGFVTPNAMLITFIADHGFEMGLYFKDWVQTLPAAQIAADVTLAYLAFAVWAIWDGRRIGQRSWWVVIPAALLIGACFAIPLHLLLRDRTLRLHHGEADRGPLPA